MSNVFVGPGVLNGRITPPPSKSDAHRALICAALAGKPESVQGLEPPFSEDLLATQSCLAALSQPGAVLDCGESGTTLRLILPIAAALGRQSRFVGHGRLPARPLREYEQILGPHGIEFNFPAAGSLPLTISGQLRAGDYALRGDISSQYLSGLLLALPLLEGNSKISLTTPLESAPYVEMTLNTMRRFGVKVEQSAACSVSGGQFVVSGGQKYQPTAYTVERDYSQAAFWLTANFSGSNLQVAGLSADSCQGDKKIVEILAEFSSGQAAGRSLYTIDASQIPDLVPIIAVAAAQLDAITTIVRAARLRFKESDRLASTTAALNAIGADVNETDDGLQINGGDYNRRLSTGDHSHTAPVFTGGIADSAGDHRITMALAVAALRSKNGVTIQGAESVRKSYPDFFLEFSRLGGDVNGLDLG